jgi:hypothetical protein
LISTTASDACEEKYFIYRVHHLRGFLSQASSHRELDSLRLKFIYLLLASSVHQKTTELNNHMHGLLPVATSYRELESLTGASSCFWKFIILTPDFSLKKLDSLTAACLVFTFFSSDFSPSNLWTANSLLNPSFAWLASCHWLPQNES